MAPPRHLAVTAIALAAILGHGCGNGDSSPGSIVPPDTCVEFTPAAASAPGTVAAQKNASSSCGAVGVDLVVTDVADIFAIEVTVAYDPAVVTYEGVSTSGSLLGSDGTSLEVLDGGQSGLIAVSISRFGVVSGVDAVGSQTLATLLFSRPGDAGVTGLSFSAAALYDGDAPPQPIPVQWFGGGFTVE